MRLDRSVALREPESSYNEVREYCRETREVLDRLEYDVIESVIQEFIKLKRRWGRLFVLGSGGSAANASHAVNDFRKLAGFDAYCPSDNVAELTARINDEGWETSYANWLKVSRLGFNDLVLVLSVGGGSLEPPVSVNLIHAMDYAYEMGARIVGIVGRDGGYTKTLAKACIIIPTVNEHRVTAHVESFQSVFCHMIATDSRVSIAKGKWESL